MRTLVFALLAFPSSALADPPSPEDVAKIQYEQDKASAEIDKKYGGKKSSELSTDERREMMKEKAAADRAVLDQHGVSTKDFARSQAKQSLTDRAKTKDAAEKLEKDSKKTDSSSGGQKEIVIEKGGTATSDADEAAAADRAAGYGKGGGKKSK